VDFLSFQESRMNKISSFATTPLHRCLTAGLTALTLGFASHAMAAGDKAAYKAAEDSAKTTYDSAKKACDSLSGNAKDVCVLEAKGARDKAIAEAEATEKGTPKARRDAREAAIKADYNVAKEKCDDLAGNAKDVCVKEAKAARDKSEADLKAMKDSAETRKDTMQAKNDADYKVAAEKCDALAGDAKSNCLASAKARYHQ